MGNITKTESVAFQEVILSKKVLKATNPKLVLGNLVMRLDEEAKGQSAVDVPNLSNLEANEKVKNLPVQPQAPTETDVTLTIDQHFETSVIVEDFAKLVSKKNLKDLYTERASTAIAKKIDASIAALASGFSGTKGTYNTAITADVILDSIELLDLADVPEEDRHFVFRADVKRDLLDLTVYTSKDFVSGGPVETGMIGDLYGVSTYMSNNLVKSGNNTNNMLFHRDALALGLAMGPRVQSGYELSELADLVVCDAAWGVKEMRDDFGVLVKT